MSISSTHRMMAALMISTATTLPLAAIAHANPPDISYDILSPSGDVSCWLDGASINPNDDYGQAECIVVDRQWAAPRLPAKCPNPHEPVFYLSARPAIGPGDPGHLLQCHANTGLSFDPGAKVLDYGQTRLVGRIACESEPNGITCTDTSSGHFFRASRDSYDVG